MLWQWMIIVCIGSMASVVAEPLSLRSAVQKGDIKSAIESGRALADKSPEEAVWLAVALHEDQETEQAFLVFLRALEQTTSIGGASSAMDEAIYRATLDDYLAMRGKETAGKAGHLKVKLEPIVHEHSEYYQCGYLLASTYANEGDFSAFFPLFYDCYKSQSTHYLAYKTLAMLHLRLWQRGATPEEKENQREAVSAFVNHALSLYSGDASLHRLNIDFAALGAKRTAVSRSLNNIIDHNILIPRDEVVYYVQAALDTEQKPLAQRLIRHARSRYKRSRALDAAQQLVDK